MSFWKKILGGDFASHRATGDEHFQGGRFGEAKLAYDRALDKARNEPAEAVEAVRERVRACRRALAEGHAQRVATCIEQDDPEAAIEALESAIEVSDDPEAKDRYRRRIDELHAQEARTGAEVPGEASEEDRYEVLSADWEEEQLDEYDGYGEAFRHAYLSLHENPSDESATAALAAFREMAEKAGARARFVYLEIGRAELRLGRRDEGIASLRTFLDRLPEELGETSRVHAHFALADAYLEAKDEGAAERELVAATEAAPDLTAGHLRLGQFLRLRGRCQEAVSPLEEAARTMGEVRPDVRVLREIGLNQIGLGDENAAMDTLDGVVQLQATQDNLDLDPPSAVALAALYEKRGDPGRAADLYRHLARGSDIENHFQYHRQAARLLAAAGNRKQAHEYVVKARELAPDDEARRSLDEIG
jgi:tetratricopeptide (TPR) repeat protein